VARPEPKGDTALVLLAPGADSIVRELRNRFDPAAFAGVQAHVTVLCPFVPGADLDDLVEAAVGGLTSSHVTFDLNLTGVRCWPGVVYLEAEPGGPIQALTGDAAKRWRQHPLDDVVPHLTIGHGGDGLFREAVDYLSPHLPLRLRAAELLLLVTDGERWSRIRTFPLGE